MNKQTKKIIEIIDERIKFFTKKINNCNTHAISKLPKDMADIEMQMFEQYCGSEKTARQIKDLILKEVSVKHSLTNGDKR